MGYCATLKLNRPQVIPLISQKELEQLLDKLEDDDPTFEGVVIRDRNNTRLKIKSKSYLRLHRIFSCGEPKTEQLLDIIFNKEEDEILLYWPEYTLRISGIKQNLVKLYKEVEALWYCFHDQKNRKKFALSIKDHPLCAVLFQLKDEKGTMRELFNQVIVKKCHLLEKE